MFCFSYVWVNDMRRAGDDNIVYRSPVFCQRNRIRFTGDFRRWLSRQGVSHFDVCEDASGITIDASDYASGLRFHMVGWVVENELNESKPVTDGIRHSKHLKLW